MELVKCWKLIFDVYDEQGVDVGYEIYLGEDVFDGVMFEMFLEVFGGYLCCQINYDLLYFLL